MTARLIICRDENIDYDDGHNWLTFFETDSGRKTGRRYSSEQAARNGVREQFLGKHPIVVEQVKS